MLRLDLIIRRREPQLTRGAAIGAAFSAKSGCR
jgi:hypothetical protein